MFILVILFIIIAISLNYFNKNQLFQLNSSNKNNMILISNLYDNDSSIITVYLWKRIAIILTICSLPLLWESRIFEDVYLYNGLLLLNNRLNLVSWLLVITGISLISIAPANIVNFAKINAETKNPLNERIVFTLCAILGGIILNSAVDFLTILLGLELQSYSVYILAASYRDYEPSEAAGLKYFLLGALSSALVFMGLAVLYIYSGSTNLDTAFLMLSSSLQPNLNMSDLALKSNAILPYIGIILIFAGISWKVAAAPVQAWSIDVYDAVPTRTTAILSLIPKIALFTLLMRLISLITSPASWSTNLGDGLLSPFSDSINQESNQVAIQIIILVIALSLIIGSVAGLFQPRIKRLLAYSSVLNVGFILMGALLSHSVASSGSCPDYYNPLLYIIQYIITTAAIWLCLINLSNIFGVYSFGKINKKTNYVNQDFDITLISQLQGIHTNPEKNSSFSINSYCTVIAIILTALILSTAGIPPMVGFYAKYSVILLALQSGYTSLALLAVLASMISTIYYLGVIRAIWGKSSILELVSFSNLSLFIFNKNISEKINDLNKDEKVLSQTNNVNFSNSYSFLFFNNNSIPKITALSNSKSKLYEGTLFISFFSLCIILYLLQYSVVYTLICL